MPDDPYAELLNWAGQLPNREGERMSCDCRKDFVGAHELERAVATLLLTPTEAKAIYLMQLEMLGLHLPEKTQ